MSTQRSSSPLPPQTTTSIKMMDDPTGNDPDVEPIVPPRRKRRGRSLSVNRLSLTVQTSLDSEPNQFNMVHNNFGYDRGIVFF